MSNELTYSNELHVTADGLLNIYIEHIGPKVFEGDKHARITFHNGETDVFVIEVRANDIEVIGGDGNE